MRYICVITLLYVASAVTSVFPIGFKFNHLQLKLNISRLDMRKIEAKWIEQPLDNFDKHEKRTLKMRYYQNLDLWKPSGPIYIFIGGEWEILPGCIRDDRRSLIAQMARDTNGAMFATQHRYYGDSLPDIPNNDKIKYYKYLSSRQALADVANLITMLKSDPKFQSSPVVVVGISYAGNLAAWMRALYPDLVDAGVAISAPVLAKKDFHEYYDIVRYTFSKYGPENCLQHIENTFKKYETLLKTETGRETLKKKFNWHSDLTLLEDQQYLFYILYSHMGSAAQRGSPLDVCNQYTSSSDNLTLNLVHHRTSNIRLRNGETDDNHFYEIDDYDAWTYQYCNEFGYLQTTSSEKQPFVHWNPVEFMLSLCRGYVEGDIEKRIDDGVAKTNAMYGGLNPKVSKVVFTHGDMDPWRALGVQRDLAPDAPSFVINGTAHGGLIAERNGEPKEMTEKRKYIKDLIKKWISF